MIRRRPEVVTLARELRQTPMSYKRIAKELEARGYVNPNGERYGISSIRNFLNRAKNKTTGEVQMTLP
jgi:Mn-dependent DtxR family transcriptional regulator